MEIFPITAAVSVEAQLCAKMAPQLQAQATTMTLTASASIQAILLIVSQGQMETLSHPKRHKKRQVKSHRNVRRKRHLLRMKRAPQLKKRKAATKRILRRRSRRIKRRARSPLRRKTSPKSRRKSIMRRVKQKVMMCRPKPKLPLRPQKISKSLIRINQRRVPTRLR